MADTSSHTKVTRKRLDDDQAAATSVTPPTPRRRRTPWRALGDYFAGSWRELRQVTWPNRRATWALTVAVIVFTVIMTLFIVLIDTGLKLLFERIIS